jgi:hypothetical protein
MLHAGHGPQDHARVMQVFGFLEFGGESGGEERVGTGVAGSGKRLHQIELVLLDGQVKPAGI